MDSTWNSTWIPWIPGGFHMDYTGEGKDLLLTPNRAIQPVGVILLLLSYKMPMVRSLTTLLLLLLEGISLRPSSSSKQSSFPQGLHF